ncbi:MAG: triose-phosphate isomerase [Thermomicrobiaceae bacterium]
MRTLIVAGNWKMNTSLDEATRLASDVRSKISAVDNVERILIPPFPWIIPVGEVIAGSGITVGAQNCYSEPSGAFTGEVAAEMLSPHCSHVVVGHSERRHVFGETDEEVAGKVKAVLRSGAGVILCVGETLAERDSGSAQDVVRVQLSRGLEGATDDEMDRVVVAYEPVWAIGTGKAASVDDAQEMAHFVRLTIAERFGQTIANGLRIQYGGSVKSENAHSFMLCPDVDGALVGGASLDSDEFAAIVNAAAGESN